MVSFDLDMTLLDHKTWKIPDSDMEAIERMRGRHRIVLATGRDMDNRYSEGLKELIRPDAIVHLNGTKVTVGEQVIFEHFFSKETLRELLTYCDAAGYGMGITVGWEDFYTHPEVISAMDLTRWGRSDRDFKDWRKLLEMPVRTLAFVGNEEQAKDLERRFPQLNFPMFAGKTGADVIEKGMSKAEGLIRLSRYFGEKEDLSQLIAFGDSMNDYEIIRAAGIGVAMGNAIEELKTAADYVTDDIGRDGVYKACLHFGLI